MSGNEARTPTPTDVNTAALSALADHTGGTIETFALDARSDDSVAEGVARAKPDVLVLVLFGKDMSTAIRLATSMTKK